MLCDFCKIDYKDEFLSREKIENGERVIICESCKVKLKKED